MTFSLLFALSCDSCLYLNLENKFNPIYIYIIGLNEFLRSLQILLMNLSRGIFIILRNLYSFCLRFLSLQWPKPGVVTGNLYYQINLGYIKAKPLIKLLCDYGNQFVDRYFIHR